MGIMTGGSTGSAWTGTSTLSQELRTFYDRNLLQRLLPKLVWALF
jgi:hypothetical protein